MATMGAIDVSYVDGYAVTASDTTVLNPVPHAIYVGSSGDLTVQLLSGNTVTLSNVATGVIQVRPLRVFANTTASGLVALR